MFTNFEKNSGLMWWLALILISLIPLLWLDVWAFQNSNTKAFIVSTIFVLFIFMPLIFGFKLSPKNTTFSQTAMSFVIGLLAASTIGIAADVSGGEQSIFSFFRVETQHLLSEVSAQLPTFWSKFTDTMGAPTAEEMLFLIAIPTALLLMLDLLAKNSKFKLFENFWFKLVIISAITSPLFFYFHVGNIALISFMIAAIVFRTAILILVLGDMKEDLIPWLYLTPAFGVGFHMANNIMATGGWGSFITIMTTELFGWVVIGFIMFSIAVPIVNLVRSRR